MDLNFNATSGGNINVTATLSPAPESPLTDLKLISVEGSGDAITATESSGTYTFTIAEDALTNGSYKITGTNVNDLTFDVTVTPYIPGPEITSVIAAENGFGGISVGNPIPPATEEDIGGSITAGQSLAIAYEAGEGVTVSNISFVGVDGTTLENETSAGAKDKDYHYDAGTPY